MVRNGLSHDIESIREAENFKLIREADFVDFINHA